MSKIQALLYQLQNNQNEQNKLIIKNANAIVRAHEEISNQIIKIVESISNKDSLSVEELNKLKAKLLSLAEEIAKDPLEEQAKNAQSNIYVNGSHNSVTLQNHTGGGHIVGQDKIEGDKMNRDKIINP